MHLDFDAYTKAWPRPKPFRKAWYKCDGTNVVDINLWYCFCRVMAIINAVQPRGFSTVLRSMRASA